MSEKPLNARLDAIRAKYAYGIPADAVAATADRMTEVLFEAV